MSDPSTADLQALAREAFGRDLPADRAEAMRPRLPVMARLARLLAAEAARLGETEPAAVHTPPAEPV